MNIGFVGLGTMARNAAMNLLRKGFDLIVFDVRQDAVDWMVERGAHPAKSPAEVLDRSSAVVTMVFGPKEIEQVVRGQSGFLSTSCTGRTWIDLTTSAPMLMRELGAEFRHAGGAPIDAPVTGSVDAAIRGDMPMFVGGEDTEIEAVRPIIEAMGELRRVGRHGNGYVAKLVNNMLWKINAAAIGEAMVTAKLAGLEPDIWWSVMKGGAADSFVLQHDVPSIFAGHYDPSFPIALCLKDLGLIEQLMQETGTRNELTRAAHDRFKEAGARYGLQAGEMTVCKVIEDDAGVALRVAGDWTPPWEVAPPV